ncbi:MAG: cytochrome c oxidase subunit 4 [Actinomycetota bacterium]
MKVEGYLFAAGAVFFAVVTPIYWYFSRDPTGTTALALTFGLAALISFYLVFAGRRLAAPRPEDRLDAEVEEGAGELGFYSPHSWWPVATAASAAVVTLGLVFAVWLVIVGAFLLAATVMGWVFEYYRGPFADAEH